MILLRKWIFLGIGMLLLATGSFHEASADEDEHKNGESYQKISGSHEGQHYNHDGGERKRYRKRLHNDSNHDKKSYLRPVTNQTFKQACGACHFAYQPELLPSGSWEKILAGLDDHFGEIDSLKK